MFETYCLAIGALMLGCAIKLAFSGSPKKHKWEPLPIGSKVETSTSSGYVYMRIVGTVFETPTVATESSPRKIRKTYNKLVKQYQALRNAHYGSGSEFQELDRPL